MGRPRKAMRRQWMIEAIHQKGFEIRTFAEALGTTARVVYYWLAGSLPGEGYRKKIAAILGEDAVRRIWAEEDAARRTA